jgi:trehalose synthase
LVRPVDVVILHDPQTAGLVDAVRATGASVIWRCHVDLDEPNEHAWEAWAFLRPYVQQAEAFVFSRVEYVWDGLNSGRATVIRPSIDAFAPKNADQTSEQTAGILAHTGIVPGRVDDATFIRADGTPWRVDHQSTMVEERPLSHEDRVVAQISRWDGLKDPLGVLSAFAEHIGDAHLVLAGPATESVADDPEGADVFAAVLEAWHELPSSARRRVHLVSLPMEDVEENAAIVNAIQRHADVVVQKSLAEGFGLTVAEAMWKRRPVVASRVGGIQDQIVDGESGILIHPAGDLAQFGAAVAGILADRDRAQVMGEAARLRVRDHFLGPFHLRQYFELIRRLISGEVPV